MAIWLYSCTALYTTQLYSAIHYTAIQRYTVYMPYMIPLAAGRQRGACDGGQAAVRGADPNPNPNPYPYPNPNPNPNPNPDQVRGAEADRRGAADAAAEQHGQSAALAVPQLGSCSSSGRGLWLWAARYSQIEAQPLGAQPPPRGLKRAASKVADFTAVVRRPL